MPSSAIEPVVRIQSTSACAGHAAETWLSSSSTVRGDTRASSRATSTHHVA
jgi:hypothetical protein